MCWTGNGTILRWATPIAVTSCLWAPLGRVLMLCNQRKVKCSTIDIESRAEENGDVAFVLAVAGGSVVVQVEGLT